MELAISVLVTLVLIVTYTIVEYMIVPKQPRGSAAGAVSVLLFLVSLGAVIVTIGLSLETILGG